MLEHYIHPMVFPSMIPRWHEQLVTTSLTVITERAHICQPIHTKLNWNHPQRTHKHAKTHSYYTHKIQPPQTSKTKWNNRQEHTETCFPMVTTFGLCSIAKLWTDFVSSTKKMLNIFTYYRRSLYINNCNHIKNLMTNSQNHMCILELCIFNDYTIL